VTGVASQEGGPAAVAGTIVEVLSLPRGAVRIHRHRAGAAVAPDRTVASENKEVTRLLLYSPAVTRAFTREGPLAVYTEFHDVSEWFEKVTLRATVSSPRTGSGARSVTHGREVAFTVN
jgi:hypothetical protein